MRRLGGGTLTRPKSLGPPEPWRLLRALIAAYWRKGDRERWSRESLDQLVDALSGALPVYGLPEGAIHAHTRHYMPVGTIEKGREKTTLIFDAFLRLPEKGSITAAWPGITLDTESFALATDLASAIGYLGRAESWTECEALATWDGEVNCRPLGYGAFRRPGAPPRPPLARDVRRRASPADRGRGGTHSSRGQEATFAQTVGERGLQVVSEQGQRDGHIA